MQRQANFFTFDLNNTNDTQLQRQEDRQFQCQTCFEDFETYEGLRDHIAEYQSEQQRLTVRLLEAQAHLPQNIGSEWGIENDSENEGAGHNDGDERDRSDDDRTNDRPLTADAPSQCPYPRCPCKIWFRTRQRLQRHYESHLRCHEICVYCRQLFTQINPFLRHCCSARDNSDDKAKMFYLKERSAQLRKFSAAELSRMLASSNAKDKQTKKRKAEQVDSCMPTNASKLRREHPVQAMNAMSITNRKSHDPPQPAENAKQLPLYPTSNLSNDELLVNLSNTTFPERMPSYRQMEPGYNVLMPQPYAPIFDEITITPRYDLFQEPYTFISNMQNESYPVNPQHEAGQVLLCSNETVLD